MTAADAARAVCENLTRDVARIAPPGIGSWPPAWEMVAEADASFIAALVAWEAQPSDVAQAGVRARYNAVLAAWRDAIAAFESAFPAVDQRAGR